MRTLAVLVGFVVATAAVPARAQEPTTPAVSQDELKEPAESRRHIQVLESPYEISSFYRSSQGGTPTGFGYEPPTSSRYPIAGFYRSQRTMGPGGYSRFWTGGYGMDRGRGRGRGMLGGARVRPLGLNGDLCLFAPTFLAAVGPLTGVFFESR